MTTTVSSSASIAADQVHQALGRHILADGLPMILDLERCEGAYLYDSLRGRRLLDLFGCFSTCTVGYNHPGLTEPEFQARLLPAAVNKPSNLASSYSHAISNAPLPDSVEGFATALSGASLAQQPTNTV